ncbi:MAG: DEAD/DEAH box helicase [Candidatus Woesearchaeota archaeon]
MKIMNVIDIKNKIDPKFYKILKQNIIEFRPSQKKAINSGLLNQKNLLVCTPTASGKTLIAELAMINNIYKKFGKALYIVPLKALAVEKKKEFTRKYPNLKVAMSIGDVDSNESYLANYDLIITTSEKLDSLIRHDTPWINYIKTIVVDEIHLLNDYKRGPTLEFLITLLKIILPNMQFVGLSATIGNPEELAKWLNANLVLDEWRPVELQKGILFNNKLEFY